MGKPDHPARSLYQLQFESRRPNLWTQVDRAEDATHAVIQIRHREFVTDVTFELGDTEESRTKVLNQRRQIERLIELAYERGGHDAKAEVRRALGL